MRRFIYMGNVIFFTFCIVVSVASFADGEILLTYWLLALIMLQNMTIAELREQCASKCDVARTGADRCAIATLTKDGGLVGRELGQLDERGEANV